LHAWHPFTSDTILSAKLRASEGKNANPCQKMPGITGVFVSALAPVGC
jgi:hypothetical protein